MQLLAAIRRGIYFETMKSIIKTFCCLTVLFCSCNSKSQTSTSNKPFSKYYLLYSIRTKNEIKIDTLGTLAQTDSIAYLEGRTKFGRYWTDFTIAKYMNPPEPISFKVTDEHGNDIKSRLTQKTLEAIEKVAVGRIEKEGNNIYDSSGQIRVYETGQKGLRDAIDSIAKKNISQQ